MKPIGIFVISDNKNDYLSKLEFPVEVHITNFHIDGIFQIHMFYNLNNTIKNRVNEFSKLFVIFSVQSLSPFGHSCDMFNTMVKDHNITIFCKETKNCEPLKDIPGYYHPDSIIKGNNFESEAIDKIRKWIDNNQ